MTDTKTAFVGAKKGELTLMISAIEVTLGVDLAMPCQAPFMIKAPLAGDMEVLFTDLVLSLACLVHGYFEAQGITPEILAKLDHNLQEAVHTLDHRYTEEHYSDTGSGVLDDVRDIENETMFEAEFDLPEGFLAEAHYKVVTANAPIIRRTPQFQPKSVKTGPQTQIVQRPTPSLKNIIQKYRVQQRKPLSGPMYVLVYDSTGRPVGVRSIKGPGWSGVGGGGKIAAQEEPDPPFSLIVLKGAEEHPAPEGSRASTCTRRTCTQCGEGSRCRCMSKFHDPDDPNFRGAIKVEHILCDGCAQKKFKLASSSPQDSPEFQRWFAGSKIVDAQGQPLRLYHGTHNGPNGAFVPGQGDYIYTTPDPAYTENFNYGPEGQTLALYANAKHPLDLRSLGKDYNVTLDQIQNLCGFPIPYDGMPEFRSYKQPVFGWVKVKDFKETVAQAGYDAIWLHEGAAVGDADALLLFSPHQLKSATGNSGAYDPEEASLVASKAASKDTIEVKGYRPQPKEIQVYLNPSRSELHTLQKGDSPVRAFVDPKRKGMIAWSAYDATHADIATDYLPIIVTDPRQVIPVELWPTGEVTVTDFAKHGIWYHNPKTAEALEQCHALSRLLGGRVLVTYFDEDRVGDWAELEAPGATVQPVDPSIKTSSARSFEHLVVAKDAGVIVGTLRFADYPHDRRILSLRAGAPGVTAQLIAALGTDKPIFALAQTNQDLNELLSGISTKTSKQFENEGLEELGFKPVGNQLVKQAGTAKDIIELQPDTVLSVFHGCQPDDASQFCAEGIDALSHHGYRRYPHTDMGQPVLNGLFVAPDFQTATMFGRCVIKFKTVAKNLHYIYPSQEAEADDMYRDRYPKSFRPSLTQTLIGNLNLTYDPRTGGYAGYEHQALFLGTVSPRAIERVYEKDPDTGKMTSMDAATYLKANPPGPYSAKPGEAIEPQETFKDFDSFLRRFCEVSHYDLPEMEKTMEWAAPAIMENQNPLQTFADYFGTVPKIVITRVLPLLMAKYSKETL